jgi:hypothetical protein
MRELIVALGCCTTLLTSELKGQTVESTVQQGLRAMASLQVNAPRANATVMGDACADPYRPTQAQIQAFQQLDALAGLLQGQTALASDMTNRGAIAKFVRKVFSALPAAALGMIASGISANGDSRGSGNGRIWTATGVATVGQLINSFKLDGAVEEARFINEAGARLELLADSTVQLKQLTNILATDPPTTCATLQSNITRIAQIIGFLQVKQREILAMVPASYLRSQKSVQLKALTALANIQ